MNNKTLVVTDKSKMSASDFKGGFSDQCFNAFEYYVTSKDGYGSLVFGYLGHADRSIQLDKKIEELMCDKGLTPTQQAVWLTSTDGRRMMDYIEGEHIGLQSIFVQNRINSIYNLCLIYGAEDHEGTLSDTIRIRERLQKESVLLPETADLKL